MNRPLLLRLLPERLRMSAWARLYRHRHREWSRLYPDAELAHAPGVRMELVPGDVISDSIAFTGVYEPTVTRRVVRLAKRGGLMVDVGANLGYYSLLWVAARLANECIAFEASSRNVDRLVRNIERNGFGGQVRIERRAAGAKFGRLRFDLGPEDQTGWGGFSEGGAGEVEVVRVDEVMDRDVALLKVDIEGADALALRGCERLLRAKKVGEVWFEQNKPRIRALGLQEDDAQRFLSECGYSPRPLGNPSADLVEWVATPDQK